MYSFNDRLFDLVRCDRCGLIRVSPMLTPQQIKKLYDLRDYFELDYDFGLTSGSYFDNRESILDRQKYALEIFKTQKQGNFLEIGCAAGFFLAVMKSAGWKTWGIDLSHSAVKFAKNLSLRVVSKDLLSAHFKENFFDAILMGDVFEHVHNPVEFLREARRILKPGGMLVIKTPTYVNSWLFRRAYQAAKFLKIFSQKRLKFFSILKIPWHRSRLNRPYHLYEYDPSCMTTLLESCSFDVCSIDSQIIQFHFFRQVSQLLTNSGPLAFLLNSSFRILKIVARALNLPLATMVVVAKRSK